MARAGRPPWLRLHIPESGPAPVWLRRNVRDGPRPSDGPAEQAGQSRKHGLFLIDDALGAKATANVWRDDADTVIVEVQNLDQHALDEMRRLSSGPQGELSGTGIEVGQNSAAFHGMADATMDAEATCDGDGDSEKAF